MSPLVEHRMLGRAGRAVCRHPNITRKVYPAAVSALAERNDGLRLSRTQWLAEVQIHDEKSE
jgi:hypothetical protein